MTISNNNDGNILEPLADAIIGTSKLLFKVGAMAFDGLGNIMYRIIEGKPYKGNIEGDNDIVVDNIKKYEYIPVEDCIKDRNDNKVRYEYVEGEKKGLRVCIGKDMKGDDVIIDVLDGNILTGGMTGGGKSNFFNVLITSLMLTYTPNELFFIGCDFAMSDIYYFRKYKHFKGMSTTHDKFLEQLDWIDKKMEERAKILDEANCRNAISYNEKNDKKMSYIIFIVDELTILTSNEKCKKRLHERMSNSRKYGLYWVLGGQDATKDTIGKCKMNCPQVVGFKTYDDTDSTTLIGKNQNLQDMLVVGRCKIRNKKGITETQVFYISEEQIEELLKDRVKEV